MLNIMLNTILRSGFPKVRFSGVSFSRARFLRSNRVGERRWRAIAPQKSSHSISILVKMPLSQEP